MRGSQQLTALWYNAQHVSAMYVTTPPVRVRARCTPGVAEGAGRRCAALRTNRRVHRPDGAFELAQLLRHPLR